MEYISLSNAPELVRNNSTFQKRSMSLALEVFQSASSQEDIKVKGHYQLKIVDKIGFILEIWFKNAFS